MARVAQCEACGTPVETRNVRDYSSPLLGLPGVTVLEGVTQAVCPNCGRVDSTTIPNLAGLLGAIATARIANPTKLGGADIKFLRKFVGWNARDLAKVLGVRDETVSRWENGKEAIATPNEKLLRVYVLDHLITEAHRPALTVADIAKMEISPVRNADDPLRIAIGAAPRPARWAAETTMKPRKRVHAPDRVRTSLGGRYVRSNRLAVSGQYVIVDGGKYATATLVKANSRNEREKLVPPKATTHQKPTGNKNRPHVR